MSIAERSVHGGVPAMLILTAALFGSCCYCRTKRTPSCIAANRGKRFWMGGKRPSE